MNNPVILNAFRFVVLVLVQVLIFNHINFLGYINPQIYILFLLLYPLNENRSQYMLVAFILGLTLDFFNDSGGIHAAACVTIAYMRPAVVHLVFRAHYDTPGLKVEKVEIFQRLNYLTILILTHHLLLFSLDFFSFTEVLPVLKRTLFSGIFTLVLSVLFISLFNTRK